MICIHHYYVEAPDRATPGHRLTGICLLCLRVRYFPRDGGEASVARERVKREYVEAIMLGAPNHILV